MNKYLCFMFQELLIIFIKTINFGISHFYRDEKSQTLRFNAYILKGLQYNHMEEIMRIKLINLNNLIIKNNSIKVISKVYIEM
ncbi:unnamed protein product (macronuclear) [Paramecium tetraurelia]|uniref:Uncharacterized protein n=1 Tax=Paramecium tetraurelia TaxID=5888 RepID=A0EGI4_PARTE|nr:uncharacterized protein GSPATT00026749001 [Paramecium tetraurelia]CAK94425.1 unnamed protein product [Paramecium tetraurelia]|eukprot:XP_001461798.1 hypothetical protein (macronuclear) [Paramecium tetraurelia strain d4-2]